MIDLLEKVKGIKPAAVEKKCNPDPARPLFTKSTIKILDAVNSADGINPKELAEETKLSIGHVSTALRRFIKSGHLNRYARKTGARDTFVYKVVMSRQGMNALITRENMRLDAKVMGPIERKILSTIKSLVTCRICQVASAIDSYNEYVSVYIRRLIDRGLVIRNRVYGPGVQFEYSINYRTVAA